MGVVVRLGRDSARRHRAGRPCWRRVAPNIYRESSRPACCGDPLVGQKAGFCKQKLPTPKKFLRALRSGGLKTAGW